MKQYQIVEAYKTLSSMGTANVPMKIAYQIFMLKKKQEPIFSFRVDQERELLRRFGGTVKEDGSLQFKGIDDAVQFDEAISELNDLEADVEVEPISISLDQMANVTMKPNDIEHLEGFINFE